MGPMRLIRLIALIGLIACSTEQEDLASEPQTTPETSIAITFSGQQVTEEQITRGGYGTYGSTRAGTPLNEAGVTNFKVWGYKNNVYEGGSYGGLQIVFPGYNVKWTANSAATTTTNSNGWEYVAQQESGDEQTIKYWDWGTVAYRFFAVAGVDGSDEANGTYAFTMTANASPVRSGEGTAEEKTAANIADAPYFSRLWFSTGVLPTYADKQFGRPVLLEFLKPFARVRFLFNYSYAAEGVKLSTPVFKPTSDFAEPPAEPVGIALTGTVKVSYPLTGTATKESYTSTPKASPTEGETLEAFTEEYIPEGTEKWYTVLPRTSQGSYTLSVNINGATKKAVVPAEYMTWLPGYSYTYIFKITDLGGVEIDLVQSAVTNWSEMEGDYSVYNW